MKTYFSISQTAKMVGMTTETLRHYDRINLVKPCKTDEHTKYRYYSEQEIIRLNTVKSLQCMDLTLAEIQTILEYDDFDKIAKLLKQAEQKVTQKIAELEYAKEKIQRAQLFYEHKLNDEWKNENIFVKTIPQRAILLSNTMTKLSLHNLWNYHHHYYTQISQDDQDYFEFEDLAGIYESNNQFHLFAVCTKFKQTEGLMILPEGQYLCADCTKKNRKQVLQNILKIASTKYHIIPKYTIYIIVLSGILQWNYQIQIYLE
ncbi:MAG: MerR family transcriptional regulator [Prevotella sp.]|nr:MerR family transcriptional regulator [Staphylococcus sp.]MCM1350063.1 MerR family transcriptional regulator [Prevotella sp.]